MKEDDAITVNDVGRFPAPWSLIGKGYILLYRFPKDFALQTGQIPSSFKSSFAGGMGAVMIVEYAESNVGPYGELLFIPGKFSVGGKKLCCITKIYVSSKESVVNGWENWAIPKEQADFSFSEIKDKGEVMITKGNDSILNITLKHGGVLFPIHSKLLHFPLVQEKDEKLYHTSYTSKGTAQFAQIEDMRINPDLFPDIHRYRPLMCIRVNTFTITFPAAQIASI